MVMKTMAASLALGMALAGCASPTRTAASGLDRFAHGFIATLSEREAAALRKAEKKDLPLFHFGAGSRVRQLYFGPGGEGRRALCPEGAYCDIDRESMRIVERAWQIVRDGR